MQKKSLGNEGEKLAAKYLQEKGYQILETNFRAGRGEIDIIAQKDNILAFIEVKTKKYGDFGDPITWVPRSKQRQIGRVAQAYLLKIGQQEFDYRFDVITLTWEQGGWIINHIKNAFWL